MSFMYANVLIKYCTFLKNKASSIANNIFAGNSQIYIFNTNFEHHQYQNPMNEVAKANTMGTFIFLSYDVQAYISKSTFFYGIAYLGGAIYVSGNADIKILGSTFKDNYAKLYGGAIFAESFNTFEISETTLLNNHALKNGEDLFVANSDSYIKLDRVTIRNPTAKNSIYATNVNFHASNISISDINNN